LTAMDGALTMATSSAFNITRGGAATHVVLAEQARTGVAQRMDDPTGGQVSVEDASGNVVTTDTSNVTIAIGTNPGAGTLSGTATVAAVAGAAKFTNLSIDNPGIGYTLTATDGALIMATSSAFNITGAGMATKLVFTV